MKEFEQIILDLKRRIFKPVYFLSGEEPFFIDEISNYIEENVLEEAERGFNQTVVYGKDVTLTAVMGLARQFPMMGELNVVIVKEAQNIREFAKKGEESADPDASAPQGTSLLLNYLKNPQATTLLVFCHKYKNVDKRGALGKAIQKSTVFLETKKLYDNKVPEWVSNHIKAQGYKASPRTAQFIAESIGTDLSKIAGEISKIVIGMQPGAEITTELAQEKIGISKDYNVFELQSALGIKDVMKANRIIHYFSANEKEAPLPMVLGILYQYFSKVMKYHYAPDKSKGGIAQTLGVNPFFADDYARAAGSYNTTKLRHVFGYLKECDLRSKGVENGSVTHGELLRELVFKILH